MSAHDRMIEDLSDKMTSDLSDAVNRTMALIDRAEDQYTIIFVAICTMASALAVKLSEAEPDDDRSSPEEILDKMIVHMKTVLRKHATRAARCPSAANSLNRSKVAAFERCRGRCEDCGARLVPGKFEYDHVNPDGLGGEPVLDNCAVRCSTCHALKTATRDAPASRS